MQENPPLTGRGSVQPHLRSTESPPRAALPQPGFSTNRDKLPLCVQRDEVSQLCSPGLDSLCSWETLGASELQGDQQELLQCSAPTAWSLPRAHTGDFLREKEKGSRQGRNSWGAGAALPGLSHPGQPWQQQPERKELLQLHLGLWKELTAHVQTRLHFQIKLRLVKLQELQPDLCVQGESHPSKPS